MFRYFIQIEPQEGGGFIVSIPTLPGCMTEGETVEECLENIQDAAEGYLYVLYKHGRQLPVEHGEPHSISIHPQKIIHA